MSASRDSASSFLALILVFSTLYCLATLKRRKTPPGPRPLPLVGNALQIPTVRSWLVFSAWEKLYGNMIYLSALGQPFVVINSSRITEALLDKRSSIYSDRPRLAMAGLCGYERSFTMMPYGDEWRNQRRLVQNYFSLNMTPNYHSLQDTEAAIMVRNMLEDSHSFVSEVKLRIGGIILRVAYGYKLESANDPMLVLPLTAMKNFAKASTAGNLLADVVPALKYLPRWSPGSGFLKIADEWFRCLTDSVVRPYEWSKENLQTGKAFTPNLCAKVIEETGESMSNKDENALTWAAASVMGGGMDTSMSSALTFFREMILHPEVAAKAQAELDAVVGRDRLPSISDRPNLPYTRSILVEIFRIAPATPLGIPHALSQDDVYEGYHLPKSTIVIPNVWHMLHDRQIYPNPYEFNPDRYNGLESEMEKVNDLLFGFGRRVCPGMHFAEGTLFAIIATTLATCDILPGLDENGKEVMPTHGYDSGTITFPEPYTLRLKPRSAQAAALLAEVSSAMEQ